MPIDEDTGKRFPQTWNLSSKLCDSCKSSSALLFCRADSAFLCIACDSKIHAANKLASRHERVWMCEVCEQAPASVTCKADAAALCVTCDRDIHSANPLARRHERVPVVPFYESAVSALKSNAVNLMVPDDNNDEQEHKQRGEDDDEAASWLLSNPNPKLMDHQTPDLNCSDQYFFSEVDPYLDLDHYAPSIPAGKIQHQQHYQNGGSGNGVGGTDSVVPVQSESHRTALLNPDLDFCAAKPSYSYNTASLSQSVSSSSMDVGVVPDGAMADISNPYISNGVEYPGLTTGVVNQPCQLTGMDREARVMRYREKRKNRKFEKTIRYASRKAYAETRPRIKGRFAKRTELEAEVDRLYSSAASLMADASGYGIVPSF